MRSPFPPSANQQQMSASTHRLFTHSSQIFALHSDLPMPGEVVAEVKPLMRMLRQYQSFWKPVDMRQRAGLAPKKTGNP